MIGLTPPIEGGSERHIYELSKNQKNIEVMTQKGSICKKKIELSIYTKNRFLKAVSLVFLSFFRVVFELVRIRNKYDIIHIHENVLYFLAPLLKLRFKVIITVHGLTGFKFYEVKALWFIQKTFLYFADRLIAVGIEDKKILAGVFDNVVYIPNGVDTRIYSNNKVKLTNNLVFVGRIHEQKGLIFLLKSFTNLSKDFSSLKLVIIGAVNDYAQVLMKQFPSKNVIWKGYISERSEIADYLKAAKIIVLPSLWEGLPLTLFEALASGRPVVVSNLPTIKSVVNNSQAILFKTGDVADLTSKIRECLNYSAKASKIGLEGKKVAKKYDWSLLASELQSVYRSLLK
jgi:glycosyltransferase involved in cell wall biosynthesis